MRLPLPLTTTDVSPVSFARPFQADGDEDSKGTYHSSVVTLSAWTVGCGLLSLPHVFALCGTLTSLGVLCIFALWVVASLRWVVACGRYSGQSSFRGNACYFLGPTCGNVVHASQMTLLFGGVVAVFVTVASLLPCIGHDVLESLCAGSPSSDGGAETSDTESSTYRSRLLHAACRASPLPCIPRKLLFLVIALLTFPLACMQSLHSLRRVSGLGLGCLGYFIAIFFLHIYCAIPDRASLQREDFWESAVPLLLPPSTAQTGSAGFWQGPPIMLMSFLCHTSILQLDRELEPVSKSRVGAVIRTVILHIALPLYALVGLGGFFLYGRAVSPNVLDDLGGDVWTSLARLTLGLLNLVKIPLATITLREDVIGSLRSPSHRRALQSDAGRVGTTAALLGLAALVAYKTSSMARVLSLLGCTVGVLFSLCLPAVLYWRLLWRLRSSGDACITTKAALTGSLVVPLLGAARVQRGRTTSPARHDVSLLPSSEFGRSCHLVACAIVFFGGLLTGCLGLRSWILA